MIKSSPGRRVTRLYVRPFPSDAAPNAREVLVSKGGGRTPAWSPDPDKPALYYVTPDEAVMRVTYGDGDVFSPGAAVTAIHDRAYFLDGPYENRKFDVAKDGRLLVIKESGVGDAGAPNQTIVVVQNWMAEIVK